MRLTSALWVSAYIRRCQVEGAVAVLRRRGAAEAGAIAVKVDRLDGRADLYLPAAQSAFDSAKPTDRLFTPVAQPGTLDPADVEARLAREVRFDPDIWIVEVEDRAGRAFLDLA
jgi:hypothetical protein